jgi:hypothetical protein
MDYEEALGWIRFQFGIGGDIPASEFSRIVRLNLAEPSAIPPRVLPGEHLVDHYRGQWESYALEYMLDRGFPLDLLDRWGVGFDRYSRRIVIPVRDEDGRLVGFKGRAVGSEREPRYLVIGDRPFSERRHYNFDTYSKSQVVFAINYLPPGATALVVEGEVNVIAVSARCPGVYAVGTAGVEFSRRQRELIVERCSEAIVWTDSDAAGRRGAARIAQALLPFMSVRVVGESSGDAAELDGETIQGLVAEAKPATLMHATGALSLTA